MKKNLLVFTLLLLFFTACKKEVVVPTVQEQLGVSVEQKNIGAWDMDSQNGLILPISSGDNIA